MTKTITFILTIFLYSTVCFAQGEDKAAIFNINDMNNESLYFEGENDENGEMQHYSINKSFLKQFDGYKNIFPTLEFLEVNYVGPQSSDKNYSLNWVVIDSVLYLARIKGICNDNDSILAKINGHAKIEKMVGSKFNVPYKTYSAPLESKSESTQTSWVSSYNHFVEPMIMKADWVSGEYYIHKFNGESYYGNDKNKNVFKLLIDKGKIISRNQIPN